jgi:hypothetical protein
VTFLIAHWRKLVVVALCGGAFAVGRFFRPTVIQHESTAKVDDKKSRSADTVKDVDKDIGATRKVVIDFDPKCAPVKQLTLHDFERGAALPGGIVRATVIETGPTQVIERTASKVKTQEEVRTEVVTVDKPSPDAPRWAAGAAVRVLSLDALDLSLEHRLFGHLWVTGHAVQPMKLALPRDFFVGARLEF